MSKQIKEVSHTEEGGFDGNHIAFGLITGGAGFLAPPDPVKHEVVVEQDGERGVGSGSTRSEARQNAIRDLPPPKKR